MHKLDVIENIKELQNQFDGTLHFDKLMTPIYATDASVYRRLPLAVAYPKTKNDIKKLIHLATTTKTSLIPRAAGTSLAGQCVGEGIVVDVSKHFTKILGINEKEKTVTVQPGVVRDELNNYLKPFGLFFGPNTSTSNRCMIGGMVGNNSSGTTSIKYGVTRDKVLELKTILSDGSEAVFHELNSEEFHSKRGLASLEGQIYKTIYSELASETVQNRIHKEFPKPEIHRRNTGYAIDELIKTEVFSSSNEKINLCKLLAGSEGTLAFVTEIKFKLNSLPPTHSAMVALHFNSIEDCLNSVQPVMTHDLYSCEMMDKTILDCTKRNKAQQENRQFIVGDPKAILMCEIRSNDATDLNQQMQELISTIEKSVLSYAHPILNGEDIEKAVELRKAGLGLLGNIIGDNKSAACIEDTAVALPDLANYVSEFTELMTSYSMGILREAEKCNGSGDCRKLSDFGGTMCPSYRATRNEKDTTRARANALREFLTHSNQSNKFNHSELKDVFDLCLSCKACASECPSSVDVASLKAEFQYQYQKSNGFKFKDRFFAKSTKYNKIASKAPKLSNLLFQNGLTSSLLKGFLGIHQKRTLPIISKSFSKLDSTIKGLSPSDPIKTVYLFVDEFTSYLESEIATDTEVLLNSLGYKVLLVNNLESGRSFISKGFLDEAKDISNQNVSFLKDLISKETPLIGIEPSAILSFRDDYLKLADDKISTKKITGETFLIEEFLQQEGKLGNIKSDQFKKNYKIIKFHGHCYQKALSNQSSSFDILNLPENYEVSIIPSGCCGMAGSFGYEKEHYEISMQIGEQTLFPAIRSANQNVIIAANGTNCRHQIKDGTQLKALHPVTILKEALL
ncbi:FAD/FMN-containing dehydrogenase [Flavobacteriaceae bacterium MAR_2010_105]|nr:FAD/FMN-containing dehydrogenase [Flavobacteriaceae bacterium MAR_2010_105]